MGRLIPTTPNENTRVPSMTLVPMNQNILHIKASELDSWGMDINSEGKGTWYKCKISYSHNRFFLRAHPGYEREDATYVQLRGRVVVSTSDIFRYQYPTGDTVDLKPQQVTHIFDMAGQILLTKVWCK